MLWILWKREISLLQQALLQDTIATCSGEAREQVGEFLGRSHCRVTVTGSTPKDIQVDGSQGESVERDQPCPGALGCGREGAGAIPSRWWAFRDPSIAGMTQTWLRLHRGHPGGDLWSRLRWAIRELLVAQCVRAARAYSHTYSHWHCAQLLKYSWWGQVSFSSFPSLTLFFFLFFLFLFSSLYPK